MKKLLIIWFFLLEVVTTKAQMAIGDWKGYAAYQDATQTAPASNLIYVLSSGALYAYNKNDNSLETFDKTNQLNDQGISYIAYCQSGNTLIVSYSDYNIDLIVGSKTYNIPDLMDKSMSQDKTLNSIWINGNTAYFCTNFGIMEMDVAKREITNTYILNKTVYSCTIMGNYIYAVTSAGIMKGNMNANLLDSTNWTIINNEVYNNIFNLNDKLFLNQKPGGLFYYDETTNTTILQLYGSWQYSYLENNEIIIGSDQQNGIFTDKDKYSYIEHTNSFKDLHYDGTNYWAACGTGGLQQLTLTDSKFTVQADSILPNSPKRNWAFNMLFNNDRLLVAGGGLTASLFYNIGTIMQMDENEKWSSFQSDNISNITGVTYRDITSLAVDPNDKNHVFASAAQGGLYEFKSGKFAKLYSINNTNEVLTSIFPKESYALDYTWTNGLQYDSEQNLWMTNAQVPNALCVLRNDSTWKHYYFSNFTNIDTPSHILIDSRGWLWVTSSTGSTAGLFCWNNNSTLDDTSDDESVFISNFVNQDGTSLGMIRVNCVAEDLDGEIWIGTEEGPLVITSSTTVFDSGLYETQIKVPRNDGTNLADYLLDGEKISAIYVDGGNRKWIGTKENGLFLVSADGLKEIHHFTVSNSPLLSNTIQSLTMNPSTGKLFIGTDAGIQAYQGDATTADSEFSSSAHAYPNPIKSSYTGVITVTGMIRDSDIKITDVAGNLIYKGTSDGGQFTWDGCNMQGDRVATGIYLVMAASKDNVSGLITKILVIK